MSALIAGFGNIFFGDDGYGTEVARVLAATPLPPDVRVVDFGIRGMHVAFEMLDGYDLVVFVDAVARGDAPGTRYIIEPHEMPGATPDAHAMELHNALAFYERLCSQLRPQKRPKIIIVGCEPECTDAGIGLSEAVARAVQATIPMIFSVLSRNGIGAQAV